MLISREAYHAQQARRKLKDRRSRGKCTRDRSTMSPHPVPDQTPDYLVFAQEKIMIPSHLTVEVHRIKPINVDRNVPMKPTDHHQSSSLACLPLFRKHTQATSWHIRGVREKNARARRSLGGTVEPTTETKPKKRLTAEKSSWQSGEQRAVGAVVLCLCVACSERLGQGGGTRHVSKQAEGMGCYDASEWACPNTKNDEAGFR